MYFYNNNKKSISKNYSENLKIVRIINAEGIFIIIIIKLNLINNNTVITVFF